MQRLSRLLAALGGAMSVACSADPPTAPATHTLRAPTAPDERLVAMRTTATTYLENLKAGVAGGGLSATERQTRIQHVQTFIKLADSSLKAPLAAPVRLPPNGSDAKAVAAEMQSDPPPTGLTDWIFESSGTFTDLCLACKTANGFALTKWAGLITSITQAVITSGGETYNPSSGATMCVGVNCMSQIDLSPIVDCRERPASGTASSTEIFFVKVSLANVSLSSVNTYASGECAPPSVTVTLGASSISVGASTQAHSSCIGVPRWSSGTPRVATVDGSGVVTGIASGTAEISATCGGVRGSQMIEVHFAETDSCDDPMTPATETCDDSSSQNYPPYSVTYTRPGYYGDADPSWFTQPEFTETYTVVCDVTDWYQWNSDHTAAYYLGTDINSCWLQPYNGNQH
jgi:hypothetical protein